MKSFLVFLRILIVGCLWGIVFTEGMRVIMLCNWHFDIFWPDHWRQLWSLWQAGWVVRAPKEWAFVILLVTFIPMLITGWWTLSLVAWEEVIYKILTLPITLYRKIVKTPVNLITTNNKYGVVKRKSYKQIRPAGVSGIHVPISDYNDTTQIATSPYQPSASVYSTSAASKPAVRKAPDIPATIDHALFKFDDDDDDFDLDFDSFEKTDTPKKTAVAKNNISESSDNKKPRFDFDDDDDEIEQSKSKLIIDDDDEIEKIQVPQNPKRAERKSSVKSTRQDRNDYKNENRRAEKNKDRNKNNSSANETNATRDSAASNASHGPVYDLLQQKNYGILQNVSTSSSVIDFIGVSGDEICLCAIDKESGDWLADEEMFNGEEPLWFSENSHRVSPVRKLAVAKEIITEKLEAEGFQQKVSSFVIIQMANIINADDMFDIWDEMNIYVTRINRGAPKEIPLFSKTLNEAGTPMPKKDFERLRNILKTISK